jgi:nicotinamide-nucleotide amidase
MQTHPAEKPFLDTIASQLCARQWMLVTAESCTGGLIAATCTEAPGASAWFDCGFITYSNAAKTAILGVPDYLIATHGAVSEAVAMAMAEGAANQGKIAQPSEKAVQTVGLAVTGIAGPDGGSIYKPVGTVWMAWHINGKTNACMQKFGGDRSAVRAATVQYALTVLAEKLLTLPAPEGS